ncbi:MAG TPA: hypothetical protein PL110_00615 [Candidatus Eremiobacteraeota bacterium]|nr:MAG: hypothetical protein BWY64_00111 [bacterium ADurb.Bin363]HPZ06589.1 hypothetical protein [Candidatus Eremiobacteraeota bacterium]
MALSDIPKDFNQEVNKFIEELELWIPLIRLLLLPEEEFCNFWEKFSKLHEEKKIYSLQVIERMKQTILKLRIDDTEPYNLSERELKELLSFSASQKSIS